MEKGGNQAMLTKNTPVFLVWSKTAQRSVNLARELNAKLVRLNDKFPYMRAKIQTNKLLKKLENRNSMILLQLPPGPALSYILNKKKQNICLITDVHTGFVYQSNIKSIILNRPHLKKLSNADLVIVHNIPVKLSLLKSYPFLNNKIMVVYDPIPDIRPFQKREAEHKKTRKEPIKVVIPSSWSDDEPLEKLVEELKKYRNLKYNVYITGNYKNNFIMFKKIIKIIRDNPGFPHITITGFLEKRNYKKLLYNSNVVIALTTREYTLTSAMWEAVAFRKPFLLIETITAKVELDSYPCMVKSIEEIPFKIQECTEKDLRYFLVKLEKKSRNSINLLKKRIENICQNT